MQSTLSWPMRSFMQILLLGFPAARGQPRGRDRSDASGDPRSGETSSDAFERHQAVLAAIRHW